MREPSMELERLANDVKERATPSVKKCESHSWVGKGRQDTKRAKKI